MENEKNTPQPESQLSPEEQLDRMLEKFMEEEAPLPEPESSETEVPQEETDLLADFPMLSDILTDIGPDEEAIADVDLIRPEDLDLEEETDVIKEESEAIEEESGAEASAKELIHLIEEVRHHEIPAIFTESNGSGSAASIIAAETGAHLSTLSMAMSGDDYFASMYANIDALKEALK